MNPQNWLARAKSLVSCLLIVSLMPMALAQQQQTAPLPLKPEEVEALVAPIALYPDALLSQTLMASTYPLEIVQAARWVKANPKVTGDAAVKAVETQTWDVSVKSLVAFPQVLVPMSDKLDWTQKLGDAFLADEKGVLDAVQRLRVRAQSSGNLQSNEQQKVIVEAVPAPTQTTTVIRIEPAAPQVIYVPVYNPTVVYGAWMYPAYPPFYWPPPPMYYPGGAFVSGFAWGVGVAAAGAIFGGCNWGYGSVNVNVNRVVAIDRNYNVNNINTNGQWKHDNSHRKGVPYRDTTTRERYSREAPGAANRQEFRGRDTAAGGAADRVGDRGQGAGDRVGDRGQGVADRVGDRGTGGADRPNLSERPAASAKPAVANRPAATPAVTDHAAAADRANRERAFEGVNNGAAAQKNIDRGRASVTPAAARAPAPARAAASAPARAPMAAPPGGGRPAAGGAGGMGGGGRRR